MKAGNATYRGTTDLPAVIPVFPLSAALLLPRSEMPLNIFEPRYLAMIDAALAGDRVIGIVQPDVTLPAGLSGPGLFAVGCAGRLTSFAESGDDRYLVTLTGIARFRIIEEVHTDRPFRQCRVTAEPFAEDLAGCAGEALVDRKSVLKTFRAYLAAHDLDADWSSVDRASNETLVNTLAMMAPFGVAEKQALLEAPDLRARAETLIALTEMTLTRENGPASDGHTLQ
jgi:Lon protease-like protein